MSERTCVVCRRKESSAALLRFVLRPLTEAASQVGIEQRQIEFDPIGYAEGRGAYVHPAVGCSLHKNVELLLRASLTRISPRVVLRSAKRVTVSSDIEETFTPVALRAALNVLDASCASQVKRQRARKAVNELLKAIEIEKERLCHSRGQVVSRGPKAVRL